MTTSVMTPDAASIIDGLDPAALRRQLAELERQQRAVRVLLRAAVAREKSALRGQRGEAPHAS
jgi:hypothetical protein